MTVDLKRDTVKRSWVAVIAVTAVLLSVGASLFIGVLRGDVPAADSNVPVRLVTENTVVPKADGPLGWTQTTPPPGMEQVEEMWAMTDGGYALWTGSEIWTSADGVEWELSATTPDLADVSPEASAAIDFGGGWLNVGGDAEGHTVIAHSSDGAAWGVTPLPETRENH